MFHFQPPVDPWLFPELVSPDGQGEVRKEKDRRRGERTGEGRGEGRGEEEERRGERTGEGRGEERGEDREEREE